MKNFVFISPNFPDIYWKFCFAFKKRGLNVLGVGDAPYNEIPNELKYSLDEYYCCSNMENYDNEKRAIQYFENKYGPIDFLESNNEYWLQSDAKLREDFNIKSGVNTKEVLPFKKKSLQKEAFFENNIKAARYILPKNKEELLDFIKLVGYPVFAKPNIGVGAQGTFKINNQEDALNFINSIGNQEYIVEEFVDGDLISFDGIANSKSEVLFAMRDVFFENGADIIKGNLDDAYYCDPYIKPEFLELGKRVVKALNIKKRFFHIEFFILRNDHPYLGKKGTIIPLEANVRPAGGFTPDMINFAGSFSCYDIFAECILDDKTTEKFDKQKYYCISSSTRRNLNYVHTKTQVIEKYKNNICMMGAYPKAISDDMGDDYFIAKFLTYDEMMEFDKFVREKVK